MIQKNSDKNIIITIVCLSLILFFHFSIFFVFFTFSLDNNNYNDVFAANKDKDIFNISSNILEDQKSNICNCIVFRMDDIQDYWLNNIQNEVLDLFILKNQSLSLGIISDWTGNDSKLISKINQGIENELFELASHGWKHNEYTKLTSQEQFENLSQSINKINKIFKQNVSVFIPPLSVFNNYTLKAMNDLGLNIISSDIYEEEKFDDAKSVLNQKNTRNNNINVKNDNNDNNKNDSIIYHIPATVFFHDYEKGEWLKIPNIEIISNVTKNIENNGYAVIVLHPQDFSISNNNNSNSSLNSSDNNPFSNIVNSTEIKDLEKLIDWALENNIKITTFEGIINS